MWFKVYQSGLKTPVLVFFCFSAQVVLRHLWLGVPKSLESLDGVLLVLLVSVSFFGGLGADFSSYSKSPYSDC